MASTFLNVVEPGSLVASRFKERPCVVRGLFIPLNGVVVGAVKPFLLPVIAAVGVVAFPAIAGYKSCKGRHDEAKNYFQAWQLSVVTTLFCAAFLMVTGFALSPKVSIGLMAGIIAASIAFHIYRTENVLHSHLS